MLRGHRTPRGAEQQRRRVAKRKWDERTLIELWCRLDAF